MLKILSSVTYLAEKNIIFNVVKLCQRLYADKQIDTLQYLFKLWVPQRLGLSLIVCFCSLRKSLLSRKSFYSHERLRDTTRATHLKWAFSERVSNKLKEQKSLTLCIWFLIVLSYFFSLEGKIFIATVHYKEGQQMAIPSQPEHVWKVGVVELHSRCLFQNNDVPAELSDLQVGPILYRIC